MFILSLSVRERPSSHVGDTTIQWFLVSY
jgi:hypothetical protein